MRLPTRPLLATLLAALLALPALAAQPAGAGRDPLDSARWPDMRKSFFDKKARVVFDERVKVTAPLTAEDALNVPIAVDASQLPQVREVVVFADFNPIVRVLAYRPAGALPNLGFRVKLQQSTPVRAAARTADGVWHVGGTWVNTAGGGCTTPSTGSASPIWQTRLNEVSGRMWPRSEGGERLRMRIVHPMDTGLANGIPAFHIQDLRIADAAGAELMQIDIFEPVAENPVLTFDLPAGTAPERVRVTGRDNNGNPVDAWVER